MHVASHEHGEFIIVYLYQLEILALRHRCALRQCLMESRQNSVIGDFIARRYDYENVFPFLFGFELVDAVLVGLDDFGTVRHQHVRHAFATAFHHSVDSHPRFGLHIKRLDD